MMVKLGDVCEKKIETVKTTYTGKIDYIDISSVDNQRKEITQTQSMLFEDAPSRAKQQVFPGDILVSTVRPNLNAVALITEHSDNILVASTGYCVLRCLPNVHTKYIFYFCQSPAFIEKLVMQAAGASYPAVTSNIVKECVIPLPPLTEQRKIAAVLDKVSDLIAKRRQQLDKLDEMVKSRFVEMFGDPVTNPKGWKIDQLGSYMTTLTDFSANGSYELLDSNVVMYDEPSYAVMVRTIDLEAGNLDNGVKYIDQKAYELLSKSKLYGGELIINKIGSAGKIYIMPHIGKLASLGRNAFMFRFDECINMVFLYALLTSDYGTVEIQQYVRGAVTKTITKAIRIIVPPIELQNRFATFVEQTEKTKTTISKSLEKLETLKKALMQEYFG